MSVETLPSHTPHGLAVLDDILVGVNGTRAAYEAVAQAASLAGAEGRLTLLAVTAVAGAGQYRTAAIAPARAKRSLAHARRLAQAAEVSALIEIDERGPVAEILLEHAVGHGVLAVGPPRMSRVSHLLIGGTPTKAAHLLPASVLVARRPPPRTVFGESMIVASDAFEDSTGLVHFATALALRHDATLTLLHAIHGESAVHPTRLAAQVEYVTHALGDRARVRIEPGRAHDLIVKTATIERATLVVLSSRRVGGLRAVGSVSERVVHDAPCSVLVMRPEDVDHVAVGH
jgi:nucleotide-binding universal stress UspA family protein